MKTINDLRVKVTYEVGLGDIEVDDRTYEALLNSADNLQTLEWASVEKNESDQTAFDWLTENIKEGDCCELEYEIIDFE